MTTKTTKTLFMLLSVAMGASLLTLGIPTADALNTPDVRTDWESHQDDAKGSKAVIAKKDPSLTNPGTDYWWAKTFTSWGVYSIWIDEGAVGAGTVKYNPIGGGATKYVGFVYYWDEDVGSQGYSFGSTTITGNAYPTTKNTSGSTWDRSSTSISSSKIIGGLVEGHPKFAVQQSNQANALDGSFTSNGWHDGTSWSSLSTADHLNYCEDDDGATGKNIDKVGGSVNSLKYGTSAGSSDDCTSSNFESGLMYG